MTQNPGSSETKGETSATELPDTNTTPASQPITNSEDEYVQRIHRQQCALAWREFIGRRGARYQQCTLSGFDVTNDRQREVVAQLRDYLDHFDDNVSQGRGVLLFGSSGTGKDHLLTALCRFATLARGIAVQWRNGLNLYADVRSAIQRDDESEEIWRLCHTPILAISDAIPPAGELTDYQASVLFRIFDARYSHLLPIWLSLNVASADEARSRLTVPIVDRLRECCLTLHCNWPSYRGRTQ